MTGKHARVLLWALLVAVLAGAWCGWRFGRDMLSVAWLGKLFLDALKATVIPLLVAAVVTGVCSMGDIRRVGRIGAATLAYYVTTTALAVATGLLLVNLIRPGEGVGALAGTLPAAVAEREPAGITDIILSLVSPNLVASAANFELLPLIVFSLVFAAALSTTGQTGRPLVAWFEAVNAVMLRVVGWLMWLAPLGVFALVAAELGKAGGGEAFMAQIAAVGRYVVTVLAGLGIHFLVLLALAWLIGGRGLAYLAAMGRAVVTAFGTASSSATLPLTIECAEEAAIDRRAARFVLPLGATINMDGTALYEAAAVMFIAQAYGLDLGAGQQAVVFVTATLAAIGAAGIPQAGLITMLIVLSAVNLPAEGIGLILAVDWFLDRFRTAINVWGDSVGAAVIDRLLRRQNAEPRAAG